MIGSMIGEIRSTISFKNTDGSNCVDIPFVHVSVNSCGDGVLEDLNRRIGLLGHPIVVTNIKHIDGLTGVFDQSISRVEHDPNAKKARVIFSCTQRFGDGSRINKKQSTFEEELLSGHYDEYIITAGDAWRLIEELLTEKRDHRKTQ